MVFQTCKKYSLRAPKYPNLVKERKRKGLTSQQMAKILGITEHYYCMIEKGERNFRPEFVHKASQLFDCSAEYLMESW